MKEMVDPYLLRSFDNKLIFFKKFVTGIRICDYAVYTGYEAEYKLRKWNKITHD